MGVTSVLLRPSLVAAAGLVGGFAVARATSRRELGGTVFAAAGAWCAWAWSQQASPSIAAALSAAYVGAMGGSHPLAKKLGAWPSVVAVTAGTVALSELATQRGAD